MNKDRNIKTENYTERFYSSVLLKLKENFEKRGQVSILSEPSETQKVYMLSTLYTDVGEEADNIMGEFYFLPVRREDNIHCYIFTIILSITEEMKSTHYDDLSRVVNKINFSLPVGEFVLDDEEEILAYKHVCIIPTRSSLDDAMYLIENNIKMGLKMLEQHAGLLAKLERGEIEYADFLKRMHKEQKIHKSKKRK